MLRACPLILCLCFALATPATVFADATARVLSVTPGVRYNLGNAGEALAVKMDVPVKAVVESDATGKAQLMFPDDSTLSIAPDTQISLAEYVDAEQEENIVLDLVSGTARIITGESNRKNPQAFTVNTPQASIGIRGTLVTIQAGGDVTRVYLSETSGKGVSVRNINTGQVMELRKPGTLINVGVNSMEERKAQKEEAASFSAALRGKSRAQAVRATAQAQGDVQRATAASMAPEGTLPPAGGADPVQLAALTVADQIGQGSPGAGAAMSPEPAFSSATSTTGPEVATVPDLSGAPQAPDVPDVPTPPEAPSPSGPGIVVDEGGLDHFVITDFSEVSNAIFDGSANCDFYLNGVLATSGKGALMQIFPSTYTSSDENSFTFDIKTFSQPFYHQSPTSDEYVIQYTNEAVHPVMKLNLDGSFTAEGTSSQGDFASVQGKLTSPTTGIITKFTGLVNWKGDKCGTELTEPMNIRRLN